MNSRDITKAQRILATIIAYAKQPSTYRGLVYILASFGITLEPQYYVGIIAAMLLINGLINFFRNEQKQYQLTPELVEQAGEAMLRAYYRAKRGKRDGSNPDR